MTSFIDNTINIHATQIIHLKALIYQNRQASCW